MSVWGKKTLCLITGGSQGIGREIAIQFAEKVSPDSTFILTARSEKRLSETSNLISQAHPKLTVKVFPYDLSSSKTEDFSNLLNSYTSIEWELLLLVHNAGFEGSGRPILECSNPEQWNTYMNVNLYSMASLTSAFLKTFKQDEITVIVNITSLAAVQAIPGFGEYCIGKAAREMYMKVLSEETTSLRLLSYSPGPVGTEMIDRTIEKITHSETRQMFTSLRDEKKLVKAPDTVKRLVTVLDAGLPPFQRVDYFDRT